MQRAEEDFKKAVNYIFRDKRRYSIHEKKKRTGCYQKNVQRIKKKKKKSSHKLKIFWWKYNFL